MFFECFFSTEIIYFRNYNFFPGMEKRSESQSAKLLQVQLHQVPTYLSLSIYQSIFLYANVSLDLCRSFYLRFSPSLSFCMCICLRSLSINLSFCLFVNLSLYLSIYVGTFYSINLPFDALQIQNNLLRQLFLLFKLQNTTKMQ